MAREPMKARQLLSEWLWQLGWAWGKLLAVMPDAAPRPPGPVPGGPPAGEERPAS